MKNLRKKLISLGCVVLLTGGLVACSSNDSEEPKSDNKEQVETSDEKFEVKLDVVADTNNGNPIISGETNLPDGAELMITIQTVATREELEELGFTEEEMQETRYTTHGQDKQIVKDGKFTSATFSKQGEKYDPNEYIVSVSMSLPQFQDESVQEVVGLKGENMTGSVVEEDEFGMGNSVNKELTMIIE